MTAEELEEVIAGLRLEGSDTASVEAKRARGGFPTDLASTVSAFANTPGGGLIVLGLDEAGGRFDAAGVGDVAGFQSRVASLVRQGVQPPVTADVEAFRFEGVDLVVARIHEADPQHKPVVVTSTRKAYRRAYDGDYELSELEVEAFRANRGTPRFDQAPVEGATLADLDSSLVSVFLATARETSARLSRMSDDEILFHTGVVGGRDRRPTVAGLLSMGTYPQRFFPNFVIRASMVPAPGDPAGTRVTDAARFDGPIPVMLEDALQWVARNTRRRIAFGGDGHGRDELEYPRLALRELVANALVHRDVGAHALGEPVTLRLEANQLLLSNPGGLYGVTVQTLGRTGVTSARNGYIVAICQFVRTADGRRVIEALASGIPTVMRELRNAGMTPPRFFDQGIRFTVRVPNHALLRQDDLTWLAGLPEVRELSDVQRHALVELRRGTVFTNSSFRLAFPMDSTEARHVLQGLVDTGLVRPEGENRGRRYLFDDSSEGDEEPGQPFLWGPVDVASSTTSNADVVLDSLQSGPRSRKEIAAATSLTPRQVRYALSRLVTAGAVTVEGGRGHRGTVYHVAPGHRR